LIGVVSRGDCDSKRKKRCFESGVVDSSVEKRCECTVALQNYTLVDAWSCKAEIEGSVLLLDVELDADSLRLAGTTRRRRRRTPSWSNRSLWRFLHITTTMMIRPMPKSVAPAIVVIKMPFEAIPLPPPPRPPGADPGPSALVEFCNAAFASQVLFTPGSSMKAHWGIGVVNWESLDLLVVEELLGRDFLKLGLMLDLKKELRVRSLLECPL